MHAYMSMSVTQQCMFMFALLAFVQIVRRTKVSPVTAVLVWVVAKASDTHDSPYFNIALEFSVAMHEQERTFLKYYAMLRDPLCEHSPTPYARNDSSTQGYANAMFHLSC